MLLFLLIFLCSFVFIGGRHFDGGTINWAPVNPYDNSSSVEITITQSYSWSYPLITCATNVPISTSGRSTQNINLTCVVDCSTDGGYSTQPIDMLTDCTSVSASLGMMSSQRSHNITLTAGAHFYLANVGSAWVALNDPAQSGLEWSIVTFIDLRMRADGFINTPPVASVVSPQYAIVNTTIEINIPVSDVNVGDDVRCRWSTYTTGYRRRKRSYKEEHINDEYTAYILFGIPTQAPCSSGCRTGYFCSLYPPCFGTTCNGSTCSDPTCCEAVSTTASTTTISTTTIDTPGTLKSTSSYPNRQALDECGGICYPGSVPNGTSLSNCTITFTGTTTGTWYAVALQVEDFINDTSTTPMSSVPVQFLIYVLPQPTCTIAPIILSVNGCLEVQVGVSISFNIYAMNLCNPSVATLAAIIVSSGIIGMSAGSLTSSPTNSSLSYVTFTWTPQTNQVGSQELCTVAYTSEMVQSTQYCVTFTVKNSADLCVTTTTTSTTTTSETTTTTSSATTTTSETTTTTSETTTSTTTSTSTTDTTTSTTTSSTSTSTTTTTSTSTTSTTSTSSTTTSTTSTSTSTTTSSTSTTSSTTSTTSTSTSTTTSSTSTTSSTTSTTSTSTSTTTSSTSTTSSTTSTTTSVTTTTSTTATTTTATTTTATTATTTTSTTTKAPIKSINWPLIVGLSLLGLLLALCCSCCCLYWLLWGPGARRRLRTKAEDHEGQYTFLPRKIGDMIRKTQAGSRLDGLNATSKNHLVDNTLPNTSSITCNSSSNLRMTLSESTTIKTDVQDSRVSSTVSLKNIRCVSISKVNNIEKVNETNNSNTKSENHHDNSANTPAIQRSKVTVLQLNKVSNIDETDNNNSNAMRKETLSATPIIPPKSAQVNITKVPRNKTSKDQRPRALSICSVSVIQLDKPLIEMQPMRPRSKTVAFSTDDKANTGTGVVVTKLRRKPAVP